MRTWREVRNFASQKFRLTPGLNRASKKCRTRDGFGLENEARLQLWLTQHAYCSTRTLLTRCCTMWHCNENKSSALHVSRPEQNTALNARTEQLKNAKTSGSALKQESRTHSATSAQSTIGKYTAAH